LEELRARQQAVCAALGEAGRAIDAERRRAQRATQRSEKAWRLVGKLRNEVLLMYWLAACNAEAAVKHLEAAGRQRHWPRASEEFLTEMIENCFLHADVDELAALGDESAPSDAAAMRTACRCVADWRVAVWVRLMNEEKGVAPSTGRVLARTGAERARFAVAEQFQSLGSAADVRGRKWAHRWRLRWGGRIGKLRIQEPLSVEEMRSKVSIYIF
jgi:hypothetical protein